MHFCVVLLSSLIPSFSDIFTDGLSGWTFFVGTDYLKNVESVNDSSVAHCDLTGKFVNINKNGTQQVEFYQFKCFERDVIYGVITWVLMGLPGLLSYDIFKDTGCWFWPLYIFIGIPFPVLVVVVKIADLLNPGAEMKKITGRVNELEGTWESSLQFGFQLFIMLSRNDRMLANLQWTTFCTLATSFFVITKTGVQSYCQHEDPAEDNNEVPKEQRIALLITMFITAAAFKLGSGALLATIFGPWTIVAFVAVLLCGWASAACTETKILDFCYLPFHPFGLISIRPELWTPRRNLRFTPAQRKRSLFRGNLVWFVGTMVLLTTALSMTISDPGMQILGANYMLSDRGILVTETGPTIVFLIAYPLLLTLGLASLVLIYLVTGNTESLYWKGLIFLMVVVPIMIVVMVVLSFTAVKGTQ